jgi:asparagine synthetase A
VVANRKLTESVIHNYGKIEERTITHQIVISFTTSSELQTVLPNLVKQSMEFTDLIDFKRCHLIEIGTYGLIYKRRYTLRTAEYDTHLQIQEKMLMNVLKRIEQE